MFRSSLFSCVIALAALTLVPIAQASDAPDSTMINTTEAAPTAPTIVLDSDSATAASAAETNTDAVTPNAGIAIFLDSESNGTLVGSTDAADGTNQELNIVLDATASGTTIAAAERKPSCIGITSGACAGEASGLIIADGTKQVVPLDEAGTQMEFSVTIENTPPTF